MDIHQVDLLDHDSVYLIPIADVHIGDEYCNIEKFKGYIQWVKDTPNAYVVLLGDIMNTAIKDSVSDSYNETMAPNEQLKLAKELLSPVKDKILACTTGNHERRIAKTAGLDTSEILASYLECYYKEDGFLLKIRVGKQPYNGKPAVYTVYGTHGSRGGRTVGSKVNAVQTLSSIVIADVYIMGHVHTQATTLGKIYIPDLRNNTVTGQKQLYVIAGPFLEWGGYAERSSFVPTWTGTPRIRLDGTRKDAHVSV